MLEALSSNPKYKKEETNPPKHSKEFLPQTDPQYQVFHPALLQTFAFKPSCFPSALCKPDSLEEAASRLLHQLKDSREVDQTTEDARRWGNGVVYQLPTQRPSPDLHSVCLSEELGAAFLLVTPRVRVHSVGNYWETDIGIYGPSRPLIFPPCILDI